MKHALLIFALALALPCFATDIVLYSTTAPTATGAPAPVPKTGQTTSYQSGDDGTLQKGVALPSPRFTVQSNTNCILDNLTGLIWAYNANQYNAVTWSNALISATNSYGGRTDWRLPTITELMSLIHYGYASPCIPNTVGTSKWTTGNPFIGIATAAEYWSSTTRPNTTTQAMTFYFGQCYQNVGAKTSTLLVWPVAGP